MTSPNPAPGDPSGPSIMEPGPTPSTDGSQQLLDGGALEDGDTELEKMGAAAREGDARLREAEARTGVTGEGDVLSPASRDAPDLASSGRSESAGTDEAGAGT